MKIAAMPELKMASGVWRHARAGYQLLLEDFGVGMIQPRINQVGTIVRLAAGFSPSTIPNARSAASGLGNTKVELR